MDRNNNFISYDDYIISNSVVLAEYIRLANVGRRNIERIIFPDEVKHWQDNDKDEEEKDPRWIEENLLCDFLIDSDSVDRVYYFDRNFRCGMDEFRLLLRTYYKSKPLYVEIIDFKHKKNGIVYQIGNLCKKTTVMIFTFNIQRFVDFVVGSYLYRYEILESIQNDVSVTDASWIACDVTLPSLRNLCYRTILNYKDRIWPVVHLRTPPQICDDVYNAIEIQERIADGYERKICRAECNVDPPYQKRTYLAEYNIDRPIGTIGRVDVKNIGEHSRKAYYTPNDPHVDSYDLYLHRLWPPSRYCKKVVIRNNL